MLYGLASSRVATYRTRRWRGGQDDYAMMIFMQETLAACAWNVTRDVDEVLSKLVGGATRQRSATTSPTALRPGRLSEKQRAQQLLHGDDALQSTAHSRLV